MLSSKWLNGKDKKFKEIDFKKFSNVDLRNISLSFSGDDNDDDGRQIKRQNTI